MNTFQWLITTKRICRSARNVWRLIAVTRSLGTISSSRCQTTHACKRREDATHCMREFVFTDEHSSRSAFTAVRLRSFGATARQPSRSPPACRAEAPFRREGWWSQTESNRRPPACKAGALPTELWPPRSKLARRAVARGNQPAFALRAPARQPSLASRAKAGGPGKI